jgi:hypothetical protein
MDFPLDQRGSSRPSVNDHRPEAPECSTLIVSFSLAEKTAQQMLAMEVPDLDRHAA